VDSTGGSGSGSAANRQTRAGSPSGPGSPSGGGSSTGSGFWSEIWSGSRYGSNPLSGSPAARAGARGDDTNDPERTGFERAGGYYVGYQPPVQLGTGAATTVWGSLLSRDGKAPDRNTGEMRTPWYWVPPGMPADQSVSVLIAGSPNQGNSLTAEYGTVKGDRIIRIDPAAPPAAVGAPGGAGTGGAATAAPPGAPGTPGAPGAAAGPGAPAPGAPGAPAPGTPGTPDTAPGPGAPAPGAGPAAPPHSGAAEPAPDQPSPDPANAAQPNAAQPNASPADPGQSSSSTAALRDPSQRDNGQIDPGKGHTNQLDDNGRDPRWRSVLLNPPAGAQVIRLHAVDDSAGAGGWLAFAAPSIQHLVPLRTLFGEQLGPDRPVALAWQIAFDYPCMHQPRIVNGITEPPAAAVLWADQPFNGTRDGTWLPFRGGMYGQVLRSQSVLQLPARVAGMPLERRVEVLIFDTRLAPDAYLVETRQRRTAGWAQPVPTATRTLNELEGCIQNAAATANPAQAARCVPKPVP
jgi:hypothetical protein